MSQLTEFVSIFSLTEKKRRKGDFILQILRTIRSKVFEDVEDERGLGRPPSPPAPLLLCSPAFALFLCLCVFVVNISGLAQEAPPVTLDPKVFEIANDLRCPVCTAESVGDSSAPIAVEMRNVIQEQLNEGKSEREILAFFQERYGDWILLNPPKRGVHLLVWLLPLIAAAIGAGLLAMYLRRWTRQAKAPVDVSKEDLERVREEMRWQE